MPPHDFIDELELSVRAGNALRNHGVMNLDEFLRLTKPVVMSFKHAGARTWREIQEVQINLQREQLKQSLPGRAIQHIRALNELRHDLGHAGFFLRFDHEHRLCVGRYVNKDDFDE
ncbi:DNA-directed RNA polymerase subunit alpha C-terminal domain-containing protein [Mesorhizobium sp. M7A.F.Ca.MR.362.00.0.0]|uniref:DNA-directed RNA polymerase subunit alpha C-terminal domain-containing protein n=1 Tax=Mesorhizobium sp. M7A.F.Ca.MR.362.00.0.0 TaxID=2496779 RepID=UPI000FD42EC8|nr:DNA-directed RNA polymerase subunit alpha C-terminal domain-containing protein [Mesorhizobium sp. M7A.F.Ca.MR.362.00.0.0]RUU76136.1 hypothetical protein EOC06_28170 [Mesorhizobium sp. M7A.F.Ca.MR.362.00.0.0]RWN95398.1 MAG: hypothetical protein EOS05_11435 [Mesorhizobium sp.]